MSRGQEGGRLLGGGLNPELLRGWRAGTVESRHLVLGQLTKSRATAAGLDFLDVGTDSTYPFYNGYGPTEAALAAAGAAAGSTRAYPSSYGLLELRQEVASLLRRQFDLEVDPASEMMITSGASQAFDALSRSFTGQYVLLPALALSAVESVSVGNGAVPFRVPLSADYRMDIEALERAIRTIGPGVIRFLYLNSPTNPTGTLYRREHLARIIEVARAHQVLVLHDHDSWFTTHCGERSTSILEIPGAAEVAVTVLSVSKELGLPGLRVGAVAGCPEVINTLRIHNSHFNVMIPELCQQAAAVALRTFRDDAARDRVQRRITAALRAAMEGLRALGWPDEAILKPEAGTNSSSVPQSASLSAAIPAGWSCSTFSLPETRP